MNLLKRSKGSYAPFFQLKKKVKQRSVFLKRFLTKNKNYVIIRYIK